MRGATEPALNKGTKCTFQSTHPMRGATIPSANSATIPDISIHAPHARCDGWFNLYGINGKKFQSTHPMRGATLTMALQGKNLLFQSTHPMRGATLGVDVCKALGCDFNPRTPCEVRQKYGNTYTNGKQFQSTHPMRGATNPNRFKPNGFGISIHAPHARCDGNR